MGRLFVISDIHGYGYLLERLLREAGYRSAEDRLFLLGDYVNKGPDSLGTLEYVDRLCAAGAVALQGNNERKWLLQMPREIALDPVEEQRCRSIIAKMPLWARCGRFLFVHAGLRPAIPMALQSAEDLTTIREPFHQSPAPTGNIVVFGHTSTFRFGVRPDALWFGDGKIGIDTGAGHGHYLSLVELTEGWQWSVPVSPPSPIRRIRVPISKFK
ncbi:metallophosphoesterase [Cohnella nanjingensis]|uniref:Serine/threonine protein phosphatase n=1 Tax=Cohnella nanjingensis TaxID=1387779 RepID=A0A7X0RU46_9BACL|nr:metallophosphoesterase [Cohnella nanjingensis]MBB6673742.1 serine/threonine protein phosphatase [Cohnella nanjingensis]